MKRIAPFAVALGLTAVASAQDSGTSSFDFTTLLAVIWFILFASWGGFRYILPF